MAYHHTLASNPTTINKYFNVLEGTIKSNNLQNSPHLIYNCNESGFPLEHKPSEVIGRKGWRDLARTTSGDKTQLTILAVCSASGDVLPPIIIFDRKKLQNKYTQGQIPRTSYGLLSFLKIGSSTIFN